MYIESWPELVTEANTFAKFYFRQNAGNNTENI